ncbi:MAG: type IV secretion system DNA-binding domain-containing protein [Mogibacterium sp.]|nr:type IV secretion system DNA-binding domain-containing protein [Mogibacterium sp.]
MVENRYLTVALLIAFCIAPISIIAFFIVYILLRSLCYLTPILLGTIGTVILLIGLKTGVDLTITDFVTVEGLGEYGWDFSPGAWLKSDPVSIGTSMILIAVAYALNPVCTAERRMIFDSERKEKERLRRYRVNKVDYLNPAHQLVIGVSGGGKSAYLARTAEQILANTNDVLFFIDGKASIEQYSLYDNLKMLAKRYDRKLIIWNVTGNRGIDCSIYNPFANMADIHMLKDMILELMNTDEGIMETAGTEHYKTMFSRWLLVVLGFMKKYRIKFTLPNIVKLLDYETINNYISKREDVNIKDKAKIKQISDKLWGDVEAEVEKLKIYMEGVGEDLFVARGRESFNLVSAYEEGAIVLALVDQLSMPGLARGCARMMIMDIRNLVAARLSGRIDMDKRCWFFWDEFARYATSTVLDIVSMARSAECTCVLGTQAISDLQALSDEFYKSTVNCCNRYIIFRQNDADSAEELANLIGTELSVTQTVRTTNDSVTGEGSSTAERSFIISPDYIKNLEDNRGIVVSKRPKQIQLFKNRFVSQE